MTTPLYPAFHKRIEDATHVLIQDQVTPWAFFNSGKPMRVKTFHGKDITYEGIGFEGSPRLVFWNGYIQPFLEALIVQEISVAVALAKDRGVDARKLLPEVQGLLYAACHKVFTRMAEIDQRIQGKGFPDNIRIRSVEQELVNFKDFIAMHIDSELAMWKPKSALHSWFNDNPFWVWIIGGIAASSVTIALALLA